MQSEALHKQLRSPGIEIPPLEAIEVGEGETVYFTIHHIDPLALWVRLRAVVELTHHWPLLTWDTTLLQDRLEWPDTAKELLQRAETISARSWLQRNFMTRMRVDNDSRDETLDESPSLLPERRQGFSLLYSPRHHEIKANHLMFIPTPESWQVPAYLCFGNFNDCPSPEEHVSVLHYWQQHYKAELICMMHDSLELYVRQPPQQPSEALSLAQEQFAYCADLYQLHYSVVELAATLLDGRIWNFWWD